MEAHKRFIQHDCARKTMGVGVESTHSQLQSPELPSKFRKKYVSGKYHAKFGHFAIFQNPEIPGLKHRQSRDSGLRK